MKSRSNPQAQHPPNHNSAPDERHHPDHSQKDPGSRHHHSPSLERDRKLKRHDEHHPN